MKTIKVKPAVSSIAKKLSTNKKAKKRPATPSDVATVIPISSAAPAETLLYMDYDAKPQAEVLPVKPPLDDVTASTKKSSPFLPDTSVRNLWHLFRSNTTMHGLKYASDIHRYKLRGVIWVIAVLCMCGLLIYTCFDLFYKYSEHTTLSNIKVELVDELPFPSITFCNLSPYKKSSLQPDAAMEHYLLTLSRMTEFTPPIDYDNPFYSNLSLPLPDGWIYNVSYTPFDLFGACVSMHDVILDCSEVLKPKLTDIGLCYTFNSKEYIMEHEPMIISTTGSTKSLAMYGHVDQAEYVYSDNMAAGMKIIVHDPDEEPDTHKGFFASPGHSSYASLDLTKYKYLPSPYKSAGGRYCVDTKSTSFENPLQYHDTYSRSACMKECQYRFLVDQCGCQSPTDFGNERVCTLKEYALCYDHYKAYYLSNKTLQQACQCDLPCEFNVYSASVTSAYFPSHLNEVFLQNMGFQNLRTNFMEVRIFFDTLSFLKVEYIPEYDVEKIISTLGGQMGIFLGASLLTLSELMEFLLMAALVVCKRFAQRRNQ